MSTGFFARWSSMKRETERRRAEHESAQRSRTALRASAELPANASDDETKPTETLPAETTKQIDPETPTPHNAMGAVDPRGLLQTNVPQEVVHAALRQAWTADPAIRDFIGLSENSWDFTAPEGVPGFGPLPATADIRQMVTEISGKLADYGDFVAAEVRPGEQSPSRGAACTAVPNGTDDPKPDADASQASGQITNTTNVETSCAKLSTAQSKTLSGPQAEPYVDTVARRHGRALPV